MDARLNGQTGRQSDRWRFRTLDRISCRAQALGLDQDGLSRDYLDLHQASLAAAAVVEIPPGVLLPEDWKVVHGRRIPLGPHITKKGGVALSLGVRHCIRSSAALGRKSLMLVDNMSLNLAVNKGRS